MYDVKIYALSLIRLGKFCLSSLSLIVKIKIYKYIIFPVNLRRCETWSSGKVITKQTEDVQRQSAEGYILK